MGSGTGFVGRNGGQHGRTTAASVRVAKDVTPGHYADGSGLYMQIADSGARSWVFRFKLNGRVREMGLGELSRVSLGEARKRERPSPSTSAPNVAVANTLRQLRL
jgi:Arm DNA-binding domain